MNLKSYFIDATALSTELCQVPLRCELMYCGDDNFLGRPVAGYHPDASHLCICTKQAAQALCAAQNRFVQEHGLGITVYDAYRPLKAVQDFMQWAQQPITTEHEAICKENHFPTLTKLDLFEQGYIAKNVSKHCFGRSVDIALYDLASHQALDFGARVDFFGDIVHTTATAKDLGNEAWQNRRIMQTIMQDVGFQLYKNEYWHFDFQIQEITEPADFDISIELVNLEFSSG